MDYMQRVIGYSLTGSTSEQYLSISIGDDTDSKSTLLNVIKGFLSPQFFTCGIEGWLMQYFGFMRLAQHHNFYFIPWPYIFDHSQR
jgi:hypothetical protein